MNIIKAILEYNKKLFPIFVVIFLILVLVNSLKFNYIINNPKLFNLEYKLIFVLVSGILLLIDHYLMKKEAQGGGERNEQNKEHGDSIPPIN